VLNPQGPAMKIVTAPEKFNQDRLFIDLRTVLGRSLYRKVEATSAWRWP
jgi:hypothetical protein